MRLLKMSWALVVFALIARAFTVPADAVSQTTNPAFCGVMVTARPVIDHPDRIAFQLWAPGTTAGTLSGTLVVYADGQRYDVPFPHGEIVPAHIAGQRPPAPLVVQFSGPVDVESAYVGSLPDQNVAQCTIFSPFLGPKAGGPKLVPIADQSVPPPIKAPLPQPVVPLSCKTPYRAPYVGYQAEPEGPYALLIGAQVAVTAILTDEGKVLGFTVSGAPDRSAVKNRAIAATLGSHFFPEIYRCQDVAGQFVFQVSFEPNETRFTSPMGSAMLDFTLGVDPSTLDHSKQAPVDRLRPNNTTIGCANSTEGANCTTPTSPPATSH